MRGIIISLFILTPLLLSPSSLGLIGPSTHTTIQLSGPVWTQDAFFVQSTCASLSGTMVRSNPLGTDTVQYRLEAAGPNAVVDLFLVAQEVPIWAGYEGVTVATGRISLPSCGVDLDVSAIPVDYNLCSYPQGSLRFMLGHVELRWDVTATCITTQGPSIVSIPGVEVSAPGDTIAAVPLVTVGQGPIAACMGTVQVTFTNGASVPLPGVRLGSASCSLSNPPCEAYATLPGVTSCGANPLACCTPLYEATVGTTDFLCVKETFIRIDINDDGIWDLIVPAATVTSPPC